VVTYRSLDFEVEEVELWRWVGREIAVASFSSPGLDPQQIQFNSIFPSPDGTRFAIITRKADRRMLTVVNTDGSGRRDLIELDADGVYPQVTWSPNATQLIFKHKLFDLDEPTVTISLPDHNLAYWSESNTLTLVNDIIEDSFLERSISVWDNDIQQFVATTLQMEIPQDPVYSDSRVWERSSNGEVIIIAQNIRDRNARANFRLCASHIDHQSWTCSPNVLVAWGGGWSHDGQYYTVAYTGEEEYELVILSPRTGEIRTIHSSEDTYAIKPQWSPTENTLAYLVTPSLEPLVVLTEDEILAVPPLNLLPDAP
jgi:hypothetical protein